MTDRRVIAHRRVALWNRHASSLDGLVAEAAASHAVMIGRTAKSPILGRNAFGAWIVGSHQMVSSLRVAVEARPVVDRRPDRGALEYMWNAVYPDADTQAAATLLQDAVPALAPNPPSPA